MNVQTEKLELIKLILDTDNPKILNSIKNILNRKKEDFWESLSIEEKNEINEGLKQIENGETVDYEEFMKNFR